MMKADLLVDAVVGGGLADIVQDPRPVGDRLRLGPWLERIAEREHVRVGADAGITEQVPGAADAVAALEDHERLARALLLQVIACADAGKAGADNQHVEMFWCHGCLRGDRSGRNPAAPPMPSYAGLTRVSIFVRWVAGSSPATTIIGPQYR